MLPFVPQNLRSKLLSEAEHSARQNASLAMRWADLFSLDVPQDLLTAINKQQDLCQKIIDSKDTLIAEIKAELIRKDDDYVKVDNDRVAKGYFVVLWNHALQSSINS